MKKGIIIILSIIVLIITFGFTELFSIYRFGSVPTLLITLYLISIFAIFEYLFISNVSKARLFGFFAAIKYFPLLLKIMLY